MTESEIISRIIHIIAKPDGTELLLELNASLQFPDFYEVAVEVCDGWDGVLIAALNHLYKSKASGGGSSANKHPPIDIKAILTKRKVSTRSGDPFIVITDKGYILRLAPETIPVQTGTDPCVIEPLKKSFGSPLRLFSWKTGHDLVFLSQMGNAYGCDQRQIKAPNETVLPKRAIDFLYYPSGDKMVSAVSRSELFHGHCLLHFTKFGKCKKTQGVEYRKVFERGGTEAFLLTAEDVPVCCFNTIELGRVFVASQSGLGVHFDLRNVRKSGRKAIGVKALSLQPGDFLAGAADVTDHSQIVIVTQYGYVKRININNFRMQGRGGQGMIAIRLLPGDSLADLNSLDPNDDIVLLTNLGRILRIPARFAPLCDRTDTGTRLITLVDTEQVTRLTVAPAGPI